MTLAASVALSVKHWSRIYVSVCLSVLHSHKPTRQGTAPCLSSTCLVQSVQGQYTYFRYILE